MSEAESSDDYESSDEIESEGDVVVEENPVDILAQIKNTEQVRNLVVV